MTDLEWLQDQATEISELATENQRLRAVLEIYVRSHPCGDTQCQQAQIAREALKEG